MAQSRKMSFAETLLSTAIGYGVALGTQAVVFPLFGLEATLGQNLAIGAIFTAVSIVRGYCVRRLFNFLETEREFREFHKSMLCIAKAKSRIKDTLTNDR